MNRLNLLFRVTKTLPKYFKHKLKFYVNRKIITFNQKLKHFNQEH